MPTERLSGISPRQPTALVFGASRGIGAAIAAALVGEGYDVVGGARSAPWAPARSFDARGRLSMRAVDVRSARSVKGFTEEAVAILGQIDLVVCSSGVAKLGNVAGTNPDEFVDMLTTNVIGSFLATKFTMPYLSLSGGTIILIGSRAGRASYPDAIGYGVSKAGLLYFAQAASRELAQLGVRLLILSPGAVATKMRADLFPEEKQGGLMSPETVADACMALLDKRLAPASGTIVDLPW